MDYEQRYKEALEKIRKGLQPLSDGAKISGVTKAFLEEVFPELKESKDEKVRKALITFFQRFPYDSIEQAGTNAKEAIAWLEKQGEQNPIINVPTREVILAIWDLGNEWKELTNGSISTEYGTQLDYIQKHWQESEYYLREKQGEQKVPINDFKAKNWYVSEVDGKIHDMTYNPTDKLEPKFKFGDWIVNNNSKDVFLIKSINSGYCTLESIKGNIISPCLPPCESESHIWTIQDAKDGDVLIDKSHVGECVFIFKETRPSDIKTDVNNPLAIIGYCGINHIGFTSQLSGLGFGDTVNCTYYPATKEQRDFLFQKMKEAGYQWNPDKKELKKIEDEIEIPFGAKDSELQEVTYYIPKGFHAEIDDDKVVIKKGEKPTEWSEDDERMCQETIDWFEKKCFPYALEHENPARESIRWLKSLKKRLS